MSEMVGPHDYEDLVEVTLGEGEDTYTFKDETTMQTTTYEVPHQSPQQPLDDRL